MIRERIKSWLKAKFGRFMTVYKAVLDWPYFGRTEDIVSWIFVILGSLGIGVAEYQKHFSAKGDGNVVGDSNQVANYDVRGEGNVTGKGNVVGDGNVIGNGNTYYRGDVHYGEPVDYGRLDQMFQRRCEDVIEKHLQRIEHPHSVTVVNEKPLLLKNPDGLDFIARKAYDSLKHRDYSNAVSFAHASYSLIQGVLATAQGREQFQVEGQFIGNMERVFPVLIEEALANEQFDKMSEYASQYCALFEDFNPYAEALKEIAEIHKDGRRMVFLSPDKLRSLRKLDKNKVTAYLSILASFGYLSPNELDYSRKSIRPVDYCKHFGIAQRLPFMDAFRIQVDSKDGERVASNEVSGQWCGFGRIEFVDVNLEADLAMGIPVEERVKLPIHLNVAANGSTGGHPLPVKMLETRLTWESKLKDIDLTNAYSVIITDWNGDNVVAETTDTEYNTSERNRVPEPTTGMLLLIGCAALALRRKRKQWKGMVLRCARL